MKRLIKLFGLLCVMLALVLSACGEAGSGKNVVVAATDVSVTLKDEEISSYDYTKLFSITVDGADVEVLPSYVDSSSVSATPGKYAVTCAYEGKSASVDVYVVATRYELTLSKDEITVKLSAVGSTDFLKLFTATKDGKKVALTESDVQSDVKAEVGDYTYTVSFHGIEKTLSVHVVPDHTAEVVLSYASPEISVDKLADFDATTLFSLYVDGAAVQVTAAMIDENGLKNASVGDEVTVKFSYADGGVQAAAEVSVKIVAAQEISISAKNVVTYPNAAEIDLTSLFTITEGGKNVPVTMDMIEGSVNYSEAGDNEIVLTYGGKTAKAVVTVKLGVIIDYATGDTVTVQQGTDVSTYPFSDDFIVIVNGARYVRIPDSCLDLSQADFSEAGKTFEVTLTIRYNDQPKGEGLWGTFPHEDVTKTITYAVVAADYTLSVNEEKVLLAKGTTTYNPTRNLSLVINGVRQGFTDNPDWTDAITVYYEQESPIDFSSPVPQTVTLLIYVNGVSAAPVTVSFVVQIDAGLTVTARDAIVFTGETVFTRDLFTITQGFDELDVPQSAVSGKVDPFTPGRYTVTIDYQGLTATATVVVYDRELIGTYRTGLTTIPVEETDDDDEDVGWGDYDDDYEYYADSVPVPAAETAPLGALTIKADGTIRFNGRSVYSVTGVDEHTMILHMGSNGSGGEYTLYYDNGVVVLDVENKLRMTFTDGSRPLLYFQDSKWAMQESLVVNSGEQYVLTNNNSGSYSVDLTRVLSKDGQTEMWYGLKVQVVERVTAGTSYSVTWGEAVFADGVNSDVGAQNTFTFCGDSYTYAVTGQGTGKIVAKAATYPNAGVTFTGTIDGKDATLVGGSMGRYDLYIGGENVLTVYPNDLSSMRHGGERADGKLHLYGVNNATYGTYSYLFTLDRGDGKNGTFVLEPRDSCYGVYERGDTRLFLDGYGTGNFYENKNAGFSSVEVEYALQNGEVNVTFKTYNPNYLYGTEATFYLSPLLNVLTAKSSKNDVFAGEAFENKYITDGAIVKVTASMIENSKTSLEQLYDGVTIITKDGELERDQKAALIDAQAIDWSNAGFYSFTVKTQVEGREVVSYYAIQVFVSQYANHPLVKNYGQGVLYGSDFTLLLDEYGRAYVTGGNATFSGTFTIAGDGNSFVVKAYDGNGNYVGAKGTVLADGVIRVDCSGILHYSDYFTTSDVTRSVAGTDGYVLRRFETKGETLYIASASEKSVGEIVTVELGSDGVYTITQGETVRRANIVWGGNASQGLEFTE